MKKCYKKKGAEDFVKHGRRIVDVNKSYECEYEIWNYGGVEVKYYKSIKEVGTNKAVGIKQTEPIAQTYKCYKWLVREEAKARIRFRARAYPVFYTENIFIREELKTPCVPHFEAIEGEVVIPPSFTNGNRFEETTKAIVRTDICRYFDTKTRFAYIDGEYGSVIIIGGNKKFFVAVADTPNRDFIEVTIYHKESNKGKSKTTYFGISPFLNAKRNITMF